MNATIELMHSADSQEVLDLWTATEGIGLDPEIDSAARIRDYLQRNRGLSFIARDAKGVIVGAVLCGHDGRRGYLHHLAVEKSWRKQGLGSRLVEACLEELKKAGVSKCNIFVFDHNKPGQRFWRKTGWKSRRDLLVMQKLTAG